MSSHDSGRTLPKSVQKFYLLRLILSRFNLSSLSQNSIILHLLPCILLLTRCCEWALLLYRFKKTTKQYFKFLFFFVVFCVVLLYFLSSHNWELSQKFPEIWRQKNITVVALRWLYLYGIKLNIIIQPVPLCCRHSPSRLYLTDVHRAPGGHRFSNQGHQHKQFKGTDGPPIIFTPASWHPKILCTSQFSISNLHLELSYKVVLV